MSTLCPLPIDILVLLNSSDDDLTDIVIPTPLSYEDLSPVSVKAPQPTMCWSTQIS